MQRRNNLTAGGWRRWHWLVGETSQALSSIQSHHIDPISFIIHCHFKVMARMARDDVVRIVRCPTRLLVANWLSRIGPPWPSTDRHLSTGGSTVHTTVHHYRVLHYTLLQTATGRTRHCITRCPALWHHLPTSTDQHQVLASSPSLQLVSSTINQANTRNSTNRNQNNSQCNEMQLQMVKAVLQEVVIIDCGIRFNNIPFTTPTMSFN